jgi:arginyl-tRNA synthetase
MNIFKDIELVLIEALREVPMPKGRIDINEKLVVAELPRDRSHGDIATNVALVFAKEIGVKPRELADAICKKIVNKRNIVSAETAGPGFINIRLVNDVWFNSVKFILETGLEYGSAKYGEGKKINIEYVSANPTGPLHAAHARGAVVGDSLANLFQKVGYEVCKEYYINDAGSQIDILAKSTYLRYQEALGDSSIVIPEGHYPGIYLKKVGEEIAQNDGEKWLSKTELEIIEAFKKYAPNMMMNQVKMDLKRLGITMDVYSSEKALIQDGGVDAVIKLLEKKGLIYEGILEAPKGKASKDWKVRPQRLFKSTLFGDDIDRAIQKSDGTWTYFASDIAYHYDKYKRGFSEMIDVWGADHGGYVKRMVSAVSAISENCATLDVKVCQIVHMLRNGQPVKMSKRSGDFITIEDVVNAVGKDVIRFIMLTRKNDQVLEFDFNKVVEQSRDNPVFYVQYAHARCCSVLRNAVDSLEEIDISPTILAEQMLCRLKDTNELSVIKELTNWPKVVEGAAKAHEPHRIAFYLSDLASEFHSLWNKGKEDPGLRFIVEDDKELTLARLALVKAIAITIASGLDIMGIEPAEELRS